MKKWISIALLACLGASAALAGRPVVSGTVLQTKKFGDWSIHVVRFDDDVWFRSAVDAQNDSSATYIISFPLSDCESFYHEVMLLGDKPFGGDISTKEVGTAIVRVDRRPPLSGTIAGAVANLGETDLHSYIRLDDPASFLKDLINGTTLRVKFMTDSAEPIWRFGLRGSATAVKYSYNLCKGLNAKASSESDEEYFEKRNFDDDDYFERDFDPNAIRPGDTNNI